MLAAYLHCNLQDHCSVAACDTDASELLSRLVGCKKNHFVENQIFNLPLKLCNILTVFFSVNYVGNNHHGGSCAFGGILEAGSEICDEM